MYRLQIFCPVTESVQSRVMTISLNSLILFIMQNGNSSLHNTLRRLIQVTFTRKIQCSKYIHRISKNENPKNKVEGNLLHK